MMKQCMVALITPFHEYGGIDYVALGKLVKRLLKEGCDGFVVCGTTAETATLTLAERKQILRFVISLVKGRVPIYYGCGSNDTETTIAACKAVEDQAIDGVLLVTPYYNKPSQEGLYRHFYTIAKAIRQPIMLYQVPSRCGVSMSADTIIRLAKDCKQIVALKYASHDLELIETVLQQTDLIVYSGEDGQLLEGLEAGMQGIISVSGHLILPQIKQFMQQYENNHIDVALHRIIKDTAKYLFLECSPAPVKYVLSTRNECENVLRLPLVSISEDNKQYIDSFLQSTKF